MVVAGTLADIDLVSIVFGPAAYFVGRRTYTHSLPGLLLVVAIAAVFIRYLAKKQPEPVAGLMLPLCLAAALHTLLDILQSEGTAVLWPIRSTRFATDWLPSIDPWILTLLIAGIFVPELFRLITTEIGAKEKAPRGRNGALVAFTLIFLYFGARVFLHSSSVSSLEPHSYNGESARKVAAYPDSFSIFQWHGVIETQSLLCLADVPAGLGKPFDPESAQCFHKPEPSAELAAAQRTAFAQTYIRAVPFPRATVSKLTDGEEIEIRSMRDVAEREGTHRIGVRIILDLKSAIYEEHYVWVKDLRLR